MVYERTCLLCNTEFKTPYKNQKYCCKTCSNRGRHIPSVVERGKFDKSLAWDKDEDDKWQCPYRDGVSCHVRKCDKCGWNPEVAKARLEAYERKRRGE